jgi:hypothetical protein
MNTNMQRRGQWIIVITPDGGQGWHVGSWREKATADHLAAKLREERPTYDVAVRFIERWGGMRATLEALR